MTALSHPFPESAVPPAVDAAVATCLPSLPATAAPSNPVSLTGCASPAPVSPPGFGAGDCRSLSHISTFAAAADNSVQEQSVITESIVALRKCRGIQCVLCTRRRSQRRRKPNDAFVRALTKMSVPRNSESLPRLYGRSRRRLTSRQLLVETSGRRRDGCQASLSRPTFCSSRCSTKSQSASQPSPHRAVASKKGRK